MWNCEDNPYLVLLYAHCYDPVGICTVYDYVGDNHLSNELTSM